MLFTEFFNNMNFSYCFSTAVQKLTELGTLPQCE